MRNDLMLLVNQKLEQEVCFISQFSKGKTNKFSLHFQKMETRGEDGST